MNRYSKGALARDLKARKREAKAKEGKAPIDFALPRCYKRSKFYQPNGPREIARRLRQIASGQLRPASGLFVGH